MLRKFIHIIIGLALIISVLAVLTVQPLVNSAHATPIDVSSVALKQHVTQLSVNLYPRSFDFPKNLNAAADYIKNDLTAAGVTVQEQAFEVEGETYRNLIVRLGPQQGKLLVIGAHYDSHGDAIRGSQLSDKGYTAQTHTPGADDNASGVAGLMELAKLLQKTPPSRPVELVFYTLEEPPFYRTANMGSVRHAQALVAQKQAVDMMVALEMIGYFTDAPNSQSFPLKAMKMLYPTQGNFIAVVGRYSDMSEVRRVKAAFKAGELPVSSINAPASLVGVDFSDHRSYWAQGFNAVMITDSAFYRNHEYHQAGDTADRLNYDKMAQVVQGVYRLAQQPE